jgi:hypothetical protein
MGLSTLMGYLIALISIVQFIHFQYTATVLAIQALVKWMNSALFSAVAIY